MDDTQGRGEERLRRRQNAAVAANDYDDDATTRPCDDARPPTWSIEKRSKPREEAARGVTHTAAKAPPRNPQLYATHSSGTDRLDV